MIKPWQAAIKRAIDVLGAGTLLIVTSPLFLIVALLVRVTSGTPVLFRQQRVGIDGKLFTLLKFRTMYQDAPSREVRGADGAHVIVRDDPRITRVGKVLRTWSIDELPQLINVLRGDMSLVGPRPDDPTALHLYTSDEQLKLRMKPGITSLAMVNGRNSIPWKERIAWELRYIREYSLRQDFAILAKTLRVVLLREGVYTAPVQSDRQEE